MPVVINEFEVVPETAPGASAPQEGEREAPSAAREGPDLLQLLAEEHQRAERVRAS